MHSWKHTITVEVTATAHAGDTAQSLGTEHNHIIQMHQLFTFDSTNNTNVARVETRTPDDDTGAFDNCPSVHIVRTGHLRKNFTLLQRASLVADAEEIGAFGDKYTSLLSKLLQHLELEQSQQVFDHWVISCQETGLDHREHHLACSVLVPVLK